MDKTQIIVLASTIAIVAIRLYQKYNKKKKSISGNKSENISGTTFPSNFKDEDYEPYSGK